MTTITMAEAIAQSKRVHAENEAQQQRLSETMPLAYELFRALNTRAFELKCQRGDLAKPAESEQRKEDAVEADLLTIAANCKRSDMDISHMMYLDICKRHLFAPREGIK